MAKRLKLRFTEGARQVECEADLSTVAYQIVNDDSEALGPDVLVERGDCWVALREYPDAPWLDQLAARAAFAVQSGDLDTCELTADRILRFGNQTESEAVCVAHLLRGHLRFVDGQLHEAITCWQSATRSRSRVQAVAFSNLGTAWALARQPVAAIECLDMAIAASTTLLVAHLSRSNLAETLIKEEAPPLPGRKTWNAVYLESREFLQHAGKASFRKLLDSSGPFPTYEVMHVFQPGPYCPTISCQLACPDAETPAAQHILNAANRAFQEEDYDLAVELAQQAAKTSAMIKPKAETVATTAATKVQQRKCLREASRYVETTTGFFESLRKVSVDFAAPREHLALLEACKADLEEHHRLYEEAIVEAIWMRLRQCSDNAERTRLLTLLGLSGKEPASTAYEKAADLRRAHPFLEAFWQACAAQDAEAAETALVAAEAQLQAEEQDLRRVLGGLKTVCSRSMRHPTPDGS